MALQLAVVNASGVRFYHCPGTSALIWALAQSKLLVQYNGLRNDVYLDCIGHSPCNDGYVFAMLNVRLQNHANLATMVTYCRASCIVGFELSPDRRTNGLSAIETSPRLDHILYNPVSTISPHYRTAYVNYA